MIMIMILLKKSYLNVKDSNKAKYQYLIKTWKNSHKAP